MSGEKVCRYCGEIIDRNAINCDYCGRFVCKEYDNSGLLCSKCKAEVNADDNFCQYCGAIFNLPEGEGDEEESGVNSKHNKNGIHYNIGILLKSLAISLTLTFLNLTGNISTFWNSVLYFCVIFIAAEILLYIYFTPTIIAIENNNKKVYTIYICNLLFGFTIVGWFATLISAISKQKSK